MVKYKNIVFLALIIFFLLFSFYPTIFELQHKDNLADKRREFVLEHNYYWPDYNLYLSKIRQGLEGRATAVEKYTSEPHQGSLIQEFYVVLGWLGRIFNLTPNYSYLLGRIILAALLLLVILKLVKYYFPDVQTRFVLARQTWFDRGFFGQFLAFLIVVTSASFPRIYQDAAGITHIGRYMEWWSNIDALQRITFIPHILFGQVISFYLLYLLAIKPFASPQGKQFNNLTMKQLVFYILLGNLVGLTFPPSLITLNSVLFLIITIKTFKKILAGGQSEENKNFAGRSMLFEHAHGPEHLEPAGGGRVERIWEVRKKVMSDLSKILFIIFTLPSLLYIFFITRFTPWSALVDFHRTHPMMIPFDQYILGTGPIFFLGFFGALVSILKRDKIWQPLIFWVLSTFGFAAFFSVVRDQSPLRFTQTGLFIPLGLLGTYFFYQLWRLIESLKTPRGWQAGVATQAMTPPMVKGSQNSYEIVAAAFIVILSLYLAGSLYMMKVSLDWQLAWISQRIGASVPPVPYPPQTMYPLREWMDGLRWLKNNTNPNDVVLAEITAGNYIPAYSGNTVYWGQSNTVDYERKQEELSRFFKGEMTPSQAELFLKNGRIKYIFASLQEKEKTGDKALESFYPFLKSIYSNNIVTIYKNSFAP